jgi:hypothetical protein
MRRNPSIDGPGPFHARHLRPKSSYDLDNGYPVQCLPSHVRGGAAQLNGALVIRTDPAVRRAAVEAGYALDERSVRTPDVSVVPEGAGEEWGKVAPPLAIEYADRGQDEAELAGKIESLLEAGTRAVWVVRLTLPRRVEVHEPGAEPRVVGMEGVLELPGVLARPVRAAALFDPEQADLAALANLLERFGYKHPAEAYEEGFAAAWPCSTTEAVSRPHRPQKQNTSEYSSVLFVSSHSFTSPV